MNIAALDLVIIIAYLVLIIVIGCGAGWWSRRRKHSQEAEDEGSYFLAGKSLTWPVIGLALFSTNISTVHLVSLAEQGYLNGLVFGNTEWMAGFTLIILALFFAPFYIRSGIATLPDFLETRYSKGSRNWLAFLSVFSAVFIHIGFTLFAAGVVLNGLFGININLSIVIVAVSTGLYTIIGGLLAVVLTETIQTVVLLAGSICLSVICYNAIGGWHGLEQAVDPVKLTMLRPHGDPSGMPWYAAILGYPMIGIWYWCTDQTIVQRVLGAKNENHARVGPLFAGFIKILPVFIFILPGLICFALIQQGKLPELPEARQAYAFMIQHLLPTGLTGLMVAALLAAAMSTVSGALNSIATLISYDLYRQWKPESSKESLVRVGRIVTTLAMLLAILWSIHGIKHFKTIFEGFAAMICFMSPPITITFLLGVFWKRASKLGSLITLISGSVLGIVGFIISTYFGITIFIFENFWMAGFYLGIICAVIHVTVSLIWSDGELTEAQRKLVWTSPMEAFRGEAWPGIGNYKFLTVLLFLTLLTMYYFFG